MKFIRRVYFLAIFGALIKFLFLFAPSLPISVAKMANANVIGQRSASKGTTEMIGG